MKRWRICVDAGHGGNDPGAVGQKGTRESDINLAVARELVVQLELKGISGSLTRHLDSTLSLSDRTEVSEGTDAFISIHCNSFYNNRVSGVETIYCAPGGSGKALANYLQQAIVGDKRNRGIKMSPSKTYPRSLYVLRMTKMPACLVELDFISNADAEAKLACPDHQRQLAYKMAGAVESWIKSFGGVIPALPKPKAKAKRAYRRKKKNLL